MKALVLTKPYTLLLDEIDVPAVPQGWVRVKVTAASVCGSDIHAFKGNSLLLTYPRVLGHELCGIIDEMNGDAVGLQKGDKVCVVPYLPCHRCYACRQGRENCCRSLQVLGVHIDGGMAEYVSVPAENVIKVPDDMEDAVVALVEPLSIGAHAVKRGGIGPGDKLLVMGAGPIGLASAEMARVAGADVKIVDMSEQRRHFVREFYGYDALNPLDKDFMDDLAAWTDKEYPNKIIDSTGNQRSMADAIKYLSNAGSIIFVGLQTGTLDISDPEFHKREATIYASRVAQKADFENVLKNIYNKKINPRAFVTDTCSLEHAKTSFEAWVDRGLEVFKAIVTVS